MVVAVGGAAIYFSPCVLAHSSHDDWTGRRWVAAAEAAAAGGGGAVDAAAATSSTNFSTLLTRLCSFPSTAFLSAAIQLTTLLIELVAREPNVMFFIDA